MFVRTTIHLQSTDYLKATLNGEDQNRLIIHIGDGLEDLVLFCHRQDNEALFDDLVEFARPFIALEEEKEDDPTTE
jgi:hypothetical protein